MCSSDLRDRKALRKLPVQQELEQLLRAQLLQPELARLKPQQISKLLKVDVKEVYTTKQRILNESKKLEQPKVEDLVPSKRE